MSSSRTSSPGLLTPGMKRVLAAVAVAVCLGLIAAAWLASASADRTRVGSAATEEPAPLAQGPEPGATPTTGSEVLPPVDAEPGQIPPLVPAGPVVQPPFPPAGSREGGLVDGFPDAMGPVPQSEVLHSSVALEGETMQASLVARTDASPEAVAAHFDSNWAALGLSMQGSASSEGVVYAGPYESLTLVLSPASGTGTMYSVYGVFRSS